MTEDFESVIQEIDSKEYSCSIRDDGMKAVFSRSDEEAELHVREDGDGNMAVVIHIPDWMGVFVEVTSDIEEMMRQVDSLIDKDRFVDFQSGNL